MSESTGREASNPISCHRRAVKKLLEAQAGGAESLRAAAARIPPLVEQIITAVQFIAQVR